LVLAAEISKSAWEVAAMMRISASVQASVRRDDTDPKLPTGHSVAQCGLARPCGRPHDGEKSPRLEINFASRFNAITMSSPLDKNILVSFFRKT
jgi:hypothetical protein